MENQFEKDLESLINRHSLENKSNTPDFLLASFLRKSLDAYNTTLKARDEWFGVDVWNKKFEGDVQPGD